MKYTHLGWPLYFCISFQYIVNETVLNWDCDPLKQVGPEEE